MNRWSILIAALLLSIVSAAPADEKVTSLKDYNLDGFQMYSGYLPIQESPSIQVHYVFITSKNNPESDDVVLWLNGGPGCSSLLGLMQEIGPNVIHQGNDKFSQSSNPYSWNNNANLLFLQSPPGVGFSINEDKNYQFNDSRTADDNLKAIQQWFIKFPEFGKNKFWIAGESYCGMYIPQLAQRVLTNIDKMLPSGKLDFQGVMIGNGVMLTELHWRRQARNTFFSRHYFYGPEILGLIANCNYNSSDDTNFKCRIGNQLADQSTKRINPYNAIGICYQAPQTEENGRKRRQYWYSAFDQQMYNREDEPGCSSDDSGMTKYLNQDDVQAQLHIVKPTKWTSCSDYVGEHYRKELSTIDLFEGFKSSGLKVLLYSGNVDAQVSYIQTEEYIRKIGWKITKAKTTVLNPRGSLQAWVTVYDGLTLYVVNAAGHMVPSDKPHAAYNMFENFRKGAF